MIPHCCASNCTWAHMRTQAYKSTQHLLLLTCDDESWRSRCMPCVCASQDMIFRLFQNQANWWMKLTTICPNDRPVWSGTPDSQKLMVFCTYVAVKSVSRFPKTLLPEQNLPRHGFPSNLKNSKSSEWDERMDTEPNLHRPTDFRQIHLRTCIRDIDWRSLAETLPLCKNRQKFFNPPLFPKRRRQTFWTPCW